MSPSTLNVVAAFLLGLAVARLRFPAALASRSGTVGLAAAGIAAGLLSPTLGNPLSERLKDLTSLSATSTVLAHLFLITAAVAGCLHLLGVLNAGRRTTQVTIGLGVVSAGVLVWQWIVTAARPEQMSVPLGIQWCNVAFAVAIALPQLVVLLDSVRARAGGGPRWASAILVGSIAGVTWCAWWALTTTFPDVVSSLPGVTGKLLALIAAAGYWWGNFAARLAARAPAVPEEGPESLHLDDLPEEEPEKEEDKGTDDGEDASTEVVPVSRVLPPSLDPDVAHARATSLALALAEAQHGVGQVASVAVGVSGEGSIFCTPDGLGYIPEGGGGVSDLHSLLTLVPDRFISKWIGYAHPKMPLLAAVEEGHIPEFAAVAVIGPGGNVTPNNIDKIDAAELPESRAVLDAVPVSDIHRVLSRLREQWSATPGDDPTTLAERVSTLRWTTTQNPDYTGMWARELIARVELDLEEGDLDAAQYGTASVERLPVPQALPAAGTEPEHEVLDASVVDFAEIAAPVASEPVFDPFTVPLPQSEPPVKATSIAAAMARQFPDGADIAVAVDRDGSAVFATADGLGFLPKGAHTAADVTPLVRHVPDEFFAQWAGCALPHRALLDAAAKRHIGTPVELVTTYPTSDRNVRALSERDVLYAEPFALDVPREQIASVDPALVDDIVAQETLNFGPPTSDRSRALRDVQALHWTSTPNPEYATAWARYLLSEAAICTVIADTASPPYLVWNLLRVSSPAVPADD